MRDRLRAVSLFSGIGGFDLGVERAGIDVVAQAEWDPWRRELLAARFPGVPLFDDVRAVTADALERVGAGAVDVVFGGSPCQDLSVAGRRAGLAGERSGLFHEFSRVVRELAPRWVLWENVPGALTSNAGEDFAVVLEALTGHRPNVPDGGWRNSGIIAGPDRVAAWRVLDARYFGVAQRRRRLFVLAQDGSRAVGPLTLFPVGAGLPGDPPPRGQARADAPAGPPDGPRGEGGDVVNAITRQMVGAGGGPDDQGTGHLVPEVVPALTGGGGPSRLDDQGTGPVAGEDAAAPFVGFAEERVLESPSTTTSATWLANTLKAQKGRGWAMGPEENYVPVALISSQAGSRARTSQSPDADGHLVPEVSSTLKASGVGGSRTTDVEQTLVSFYSHGGGQDGGGAGDSIPAVQAGPAAGVRRLTPRECERLQGFPDDWTLLTPDTPDGRRYAGCGDAVCVPVAEWLGRRILAAERRPDAPYEEPTGRAV